MSLSRRRTRMSPTTRLSVPVPQQSSIKMQSHPALYASVSVPRTHWSVFTPAKSSVRIPPALLPFAVPGAASSPSSSSSRVCSRYLRSGCSGLHIPDILFLSHRTSSSGRRLLRFSGS
ncbi:hypothetical protein Landi51_00348 [Colletotrichum acutatum]